MKKLLLLAIVVAAAIYLGRQPDEVSPVTAAPTATAEWQSGTQVEGEGTVSRILGDDSMGDRHQRFILTLDSGRTLLVAHNIDIAPRIESLREGVVHWTHHDPQGQHAGGWLQHRGRTYQ